MLTMEENLRAEKFSPTKNKNRDDDCLGDQYTIDISTPDENGGNVLFGMEFNNQKTPVKSNSSKKRRRHCGSHQSGKKTIRWWNKKFLLRTHSVKLCLGKIRLVAFPLHPKNLRTKVDRSYPEIRIREIEAQVVTLLVLRL